MPSVSTQITFIVVGYASLVVVLALDQLVLRRVPALAGFFDTV